MIKSHQEIGWFQGCWWYCGSISLTTLPSQRWHPEVWMKFWEWKDAARVVFTDSSTERCTLRLCREGFWDGASTGADWEAGMGRDKWVQSWAVEKGLSKDRAACWQERARDNSQESEGKCWRRELAWRTAALYNNIKKWKQLMQVLHLLQDIPQSITLKQVRFLIKYRICRSLALALDFIAILRYF